MGSGRLHRRAGWRGLTCVALCLGTVAARAQGCPVLQVEGEVQAGRSYSHTIDAKHALLLESIASGWVLRVLRTDMARGAHDFAELATPPYRSPNPLLISTDFSFRAQDAIAWNPRGFQFFLTAAQLATATRAYDATMREPNRPGAGAELFPLMGEACEGVLQIVDARIAGGTADQTAAAGRVAQHFTQTAHIVEPNAASSPLGRILWMRFRVRFVKPMKPAVSGRSRR